MPSSGPKLVKIQPDPSLLSLMVTMRWQGKELATGTGFVVGAGADRFLITNRHNLSGRHPRSNEIMHTHGVTPDSVSILYLDISDKQVWREISVPVLDAADESPLWFEHPTLGPQVDVVALKLSLPDGTALTPYDMAKPEDDPVLWVGEDLFVVGFPFGQSYHRGMGIWTRASVATEPSVYYNGLPMFLVDARTRAGQSGSPVLFRPGLRPVKMTSGQIRTSEMTDYYLAGVYSGRISDESDIGYVWRTSVIVDIINGQQRFSADGRARTQELPPLRGEDGVVRPRQGINKDRRAR
ncbi:serine protease [Arthrobacter sp. ISL-65]|uniref:S1 family peptidase n=1 Tax=Arthrobacter sp. ISL-65 TaxID=2819112 RepID=UPI001BE5ED69|nr:trypsin-like peptidase domain-containing protein [Arthrobacter sp. ISL-65]